jgi:hypothetical protein
MPACAAAQAGHASAQVGTTLHVLHKCLHKTIICADCAFAQITVYFSAFAKYIQEGSQKL